MVVPALAWSDFHPASLHLRRRGHQHLSLGPVWSLLAPSPQEGWRLRAKNTQAAAHNLSHTVCTSTLGIRMFSVYFYK